MGPKKGKDIDEDNYWRTRIEEAPLDEENWRVQVMLFESAGSDEDRIYLSKFETFAAEERRFVLKNICKTETIFMINQLGGEKKVKDDNLRVFEEGQAFLRDKKDVPPEVLALIIKHLILKIKDEYMFIRRQKLEVNEGMRRESTTMINKAEVRGTVSVKPPVPVELVTLLPKGKGKKEDLKIVDIPEPLEGKKYNTSLRVRGEEWRDKIYVDDFPIDGPNIYVAVTGFVEPFLPQWLVRIGVPLTAIVQIRIDPCISKVSPSLLRPAKRGYSQTEILTEKCQKFWEDLQQLRMKKDTADDFKHTAFIVFSPVYSDGESLSANPDKIYDELCFLMYDVQDLTRQHSQYLNNLDTINIPCETNDTRYVQHYKKQINHLPLECVTIYSVLDSILRTVSLGSELDEESCRSSSSMNTVNEPFKGLNGDEKVEKAEKYVKNVFGILCKTDGAKKAYRITYGDEYENQKDPIVINHGDFVKNNIFHLGNINLDNIVWSSLLGMPINRLWKIQKRPEGELEAKINFHVNVLLSCFDRQDVETSELNRLIHILACRKLYNNRSSTKQKHMPSSTILDFKKKYLKRSVLAEPMLKGPPIKIYSSNTITSSCASITKSENMSIKGLLEPSNDRVDFETKQIRFLFDCPDISELVSAAEIANGKPLDHLIDDFEFFEDFTDIRVFQVLLDVYNKFNCVDYKYCEVTDCFLLMFYNSHNLEGIIREEWRGHLPTPICLQDFFDFVLEEHYDWIQNEERIYDENAIKKAQSQFKDFIDPHALKSCIEDTVVEVDLLMEGSLKYKERTEMEQLSPDPSIETKVDTSKKNTLSPTSTEPTSGSSKRTKSAPVATPKTLHKDFMASCATSQISLEKPMKQFLGYDLGDRRVEVFGKDATYFSKDGTRVSSKYTLLIPINSEFVTLNYSPGNMDSEIWVHKASGELIATNMLDVCESFRIKTKDQVLININKQVYQIPMPCETTKPKKIESITLSKKISKFSPQVFESKYFHSLFLTWPNGLITETVYENNSPILSHIKQYYKSSVPNLNEDMRCISLNGEVIIFKTSGNIEVLRPDGSYITISKYEKRRVNEISEELVLSENDYAKTKKSKTKIQKQAKDSKGSRATSKSSRIKNDEYDKISDDLEKPIEYELVIKEFEIVEANGLHQKWILDECFDIERLLILTATDYSLGEVFSRRIDGVHILLNKDGTQVVSFPNGTRILTKYVVEDQDIFPEWTEAEKEYFDIVDSIDIDHDMKSTKSMSQKSSVETFKSGSSNSKNLEEKEINVKDKEDGYLSVRLIYTVEHSNFTTVTIDQMTGKISIDSPNNTTVTIDSNNHYNLVLDNLTIANFDGENLRVDYEACPHCKSYTSCNIKIISNEMSSVTKNNRSWLKMKDSFGKNIIVDEEGNITSVEEPCSTEMLHDEDTTYPEHCESPVCTENKTCDVLSEISGTSSHVKCRRKKLANAIRFFVLERNLNCSELVHRLLLDQYKRDCQWQPWCNISQYDTFGDHRSLISILTPVHLTETEKWLMDSKLADKPKYLTYKDLKKDNGKGFYHWMRPYERFKPTPLKIDNVLPARLPRAFILRILEQQWNESQRDELKGAKELLKAILKYRQIMETDSETILHVPVLDIRPQDERRVDEIIQALAHRIYEDLRTRLADDVQTRVKPTITTKPTIAPEEMSVMGEFEEETPDELKTLEEERGNMIKEVEVAEEMSPNLKRYWRRRAEEFKEEQFYMYLLREGSVPPYFHNVLGGAIWSQMNDAAEDAVTRAERRKMKCVCSTEEDVPRSSNAAIPM